MRYQMALEIIVAITITAEFLLYYRTRAAGFLFLGVGGLLLLPRITPAQVDTAVKIAAIGCVGWGYARMLTIDYPLLRSIGFGIRGLTAGEQQNLTGHRKLIMVGAHVVSGLIWGYVSPRDAAGAAIMVVFSLELLLAHLLHRRLRKTSL